MNIQTLSGVQSQLHASLCVALIPRVKQTVCPQHPLSSQCLPKNLPLSYLTSQLPCLLVQPTAAVGDTRTPLCANTFTDACPPLSPHYPLL
jgi:hypothetical protein